MLSWYEEVTELTVTECTDLDVFVLYRVALSPVLVDFYSSLHYAAGRRNITLLVSAQHIKTT